MTPKSDRRHHLRMVRLAVILALVAGNFACPGSAIGGKYGLGNNEAGYAAEARQRQERRDEVAAERDEFRRFCMSRVEKSDAAIQWCVMRQHEIDRDEDRLERDEGREDENERQFQAQRQRQLRESFAPKPHVDCTSTHDYAGNVSTHCE